jgi:DNA-binding IclR family transcriptional regulator
MAQRTTPTVIPEPVVASSRRGRHPSGSTRVPAAVDATDREAPDYSIAVLDRALDLLEALAEAPAGAPLGVSEVARRAGVTKSAAFRILSNLERRGYVDKDPISSRYTLGAHLAYLGERSLGAIDLRGAARPALEELRRRFGETVNLGVREGSDVVYVDMIESAHGLRMAARVGGRDHLHSTALGKAILASLPATERDDLLDVPGGLPARTERTITDPAHLRTELERVRAHGVAEDRDENEVGARCLAAPIFDHRGAVAGAISVSAPDSRLDDARAAEVAVTVIEQAAAVTRRLGGRAKQSSAFFAAELA